MNGRYSYDFLKIARELSDAAEGPIRVCTETVEALTPKLNAVATAFLVVCDTLPIYDVTNPRACSRASEKRSLAAAFLGGRAELWFPAEVAL